MKVSGDINSGNFNEFESNGFQKGNGTAKGWLDLHFDLIVRGGVGTPTRTAMVGGVFGYVWAVNNNLDVDGGIEQDHVFEENNLTDGKLHIHLWTGGTNTNNRYLKFTFQYVHSNVGDVATPVTITSPDLLIPANTPAFTHFLFDIGTFPTKSIGSAITGILTRVAATGTAPTADPFVNGLHAHLRVDTPFGSRNILSK